MRKLVYISQLVVAIAAALSGCNTSGCTDNHSSLPLAGFYTSASADQVMIDSLEIGGVGAPDDSLLNKGSAISQIYLPFRSQYRSVAYYIRYMQKALAQYNVCDTLWFDYTAEPWFASEECGAMYRYRITRFRHTFNVIDSVVITDSLITNADSERIRIYFRTAQDDAAEEPETGDTEAEGGAETVG